MALRTYGDKPISFQVEENGEYYCIGSEVSEGVERPTIAVRRIVVRRSNPTFTRVSGGQLPAAVSRVPVQTISRHVPPHHYERREKATDRFG